MSGKTKKLSSTGAASAVPSGNAILTVNSNGEVTPVSQQAMQEAATNNINPNCMLDGVFIMYHAKSDNYPRLVKTNKWKSLQSSGEVADGVAIVEAGKMLVVAPTEANALLLWSSADLLCGGTITSDISIAHNDLNGEANTAAIIAASSSSAVTNTDQYAPGFCNLYSRVNANGHGLTAGKWWLPSAGELMMIFANMTKINYALSLITGSMQLTSTMYSSSTENSISCIWGVSFDPGRIFIQKTGNTCRVRPVSKYRI